RRGSPSTNSPGSPAPRPGGYGTHSDDSPTPAYSSGRNPISALPTDFQGRTPRTSRPGSTPSRTTTGGSPFLDACFDSSPAVHDPSPSPPSSPASFDAPISDRDGSRPADGSRRAGSRPPSRSTSDASRTLASSSSRPAGSFPSPTIPSSP